MVFFFFFDGEKKIFFFKLLLLLKFKRGVKIKDKILKIMRGINKNKILINKWESLYL